MRILIVVLGICQKIEKTKQSYFGKFDEGFHGLTRTSLHFVVDPRDSRF
jgi:hypothetical protein